MSRNIRGNGMDLKRIVKSVLAATAIALAGVPAHAVIIGSGGVNPYNFTWDFNTGTSHLTGSGSLTVSGFNSSQLTVGISLTNMSSIAGQGGERLTSFGFGIDPNATSVGFQDANDGGIINAVLGQNFPAYRSVEVCAISGNNCAGGSNGGIFAGASDTFTLLLGGTWGNSVTIDPLALKYQTGYGSFEFSPCTANCGSTNVPEPGSLALLGIGLLGLCAGMRKRA
jgi:hypothetical protein